MQMPAFDRTAQRLPRCNQPLLTDDFIERARAHALGQRHAGSSGGKQFRGWRFAATDHAPIMPDALAQRSGNTSAPSPMSPMTSVPAGGVNWKVSAASTGLRCHCENTITVR